MKELVMPIHDFAVIEVGYSDADILSKSLESTINKIVLIGFNMDGSDITTDNTHTFSNDEFIYPELIKGASVLSLQFGQSHEDDNYMIGLLTKELNNVKRVFFNDIEVDPRTVATLIYKFKSTTRFKENQFPLSHHNVRHIATFFETLGVSHDQIHWDEPEWLDFSKFGHKALYLAKKIQMAPDCA